MQSAATVKRVCFLAFGSLELMVGVTRIPDLENTIQKVYKKENRANLFVFNLWDQRREEQTGSQRLKAPVHKKEGGRVGSQQAAGCA